MPLGRKLTTRILTIALFNFAVGILLAAGFWLFRAAPERNFSSELTLSIIDAAFYGFGFGFTIPATAQWSEHWPQPWKSLLLSFCILGIAFLSTLLTESTFNFLGYPWQWSGYFFKSIGVFFVAIVIGLSIHAYEHYRDNGKATFQNLRDRELDKQQSLKIVAEARLAALESRLHPHFLFNTLNSISALIMEDPKRADRMVQQLGRLLRKSLDAFENDQTTLGEELDLAIDYLEIEKTRFGERLRYTVDVDEALRTLKMPPMILQPVVENSVKFAVTPRPDGGCILIQAIQINGNLNLRISDDGEGFDINQIKYGHGLHTLHSRLTGIYGETADLSVASTRESTVVSISVPNTAGCDD